MLYNPAHFKKIDSSELHSFIATYGFATVVSTKDGDTSVSHLPLMVDRSRGEFGTLIGHMAIANSHWKHLESVDVICIFRGPYGYISPSWYVDPINVPTWNYAAVHAHGRAKLIRGEEGIENILTKLVDHHESQFQNPWHYELPAAERAKLVKAIIGFEIEIKSIEGKFKLSQNRSAEDCAGAVQGVEQHYGKSNPALLAMMKEEFKKR